MSGLLPGDNFGSNPFARGYNERLNVVGSIAHWVQERMEPIESKLAEILRPGEASEDFLRVAITGSNLIGPNIYEYTGSRLSEWNEAQHTWTAGTALLNAKFYNTWEVGNTFTRVMGGITVDNINLTMLPVPPNAEKPVGAIVIAEKVGANSYVFEYPNAIKVVCPR